MSQKPIYQKYNELSELLKKSLSISPNNKNQSLTVDNLKTHHGYIPHTIIKNNNESMNMNMSGKISSITMKTDKIIEEFNIQNNEHKKKELEKIHHQAQTIISNICDNTKDLVKKYPNKYQAQLAKEAGLSNDILHDNNYVMSNILDIMISQNILSKRKEGRHAYFKIKEDKNYEMLPFVQHTGYASKLEALCGNTLMSHNIDFTQQVKFKELGNIRIDFCAIIDDYDLYIEINGQQHYEYVEYFHQTYEGFEKQLERDKKVIKYFKDNELDLLTIRYDENIANVIKKKIYDIRNQ